MNSKCCIITEEFSGLNRGGGIGACARGLSTLLAEAGYIVDVLITDTSCNSNSLAGTKFGEIGINFIFFSEFMESAELPNQDDAISKSYGVYRYISAKQYSVVHFNDWLGSGFYCAMARRQGLLDAFVVTHLHGGSEWVRLHNRHLPELQDFEREAIEHAQIENSDFVISPSKYLLQWYLAKGVALPEAKQVNWFLPQWKQLRSAEVEVPLETRAIKPCEISELIYFGRHERRKGLELFVDAIGRLPASFQPDITFIGRFDRIDYEFSGSYVLRKLPVYAGRIRFFNDLSQDEALARIVRSRNALCVMPSLVENSPCVVGECFSKGVPFLATDVGGTSELIAPESRKYCLVAPDSKAIAASLERIIVDGMPPVRSTLCPSRIRSQWLGLLGSFTEPTDKKLKEEPLVSVCIAHFERPETLKQAIAALMEQTYDNTEIIIVDDGSKLAAAHAYLDQLEKGPHRFPVKIIRSSNRYLGAARNLAAANARGEYLLFHDDDNIAEPNEIEVFVRAALASECDILTSQYWVFKHDNQAGIETKRIEYFPIGIGGVFSFYCNRFGDANALISRRAFDRLGGFTELYGVGWEDWEFFLRAYIRGIKMGVVPIPLFNYRSSANSMLATGDIRRNYERLYSMLDEERPRVGSDLFRHTQRHYIQAAILQQTRTLLQNSPSSDLHLKLLETDPNSTEARVILSDLAFSISRIHDAVELGMSILSQREKMIGLVRYLYQRPCPTEFADKIFIRPQAGVGSRAIIIRGWAFDASGAPFVPNEFIIESNLNETVAFVSETRPDVTQSFQLQSEFSFGFVAVAKPKTRSKWFKRKYPAVKEIDTSPGVEPNVSCTLTKEFYGHVDNVIFCREVRLEPPDPALWSGIITVESDSDSYVFMKDEKQGYVSGGRISPNRTRFLCSSKLVSSLYFIIPRVGLVDIIFE